VVLTCAAVCVRGQNTGCILADFMGLGKTFQVICALQVLFGVSAETRALMVNMRFNDNRKKMKVRHGPRQSPAFTRSPRLVPSPDSCSDGMNIDSRVVQGGCDRVAVAVACLCCETSAGVNPGPRNRGSELGGRVQEVPAAGHA
jgi:hypothetical protein